jgi:hypothetical protein
MNQREELMKRVRETAKYVQGVVDLNNQKGLKYHPKQFNNSPGAIITPEVEEAFPLLSDKDVEVVGEEGKNKKKMKT